MAVPHHRCARVTRRYRTEDPARPGSLERASHRQACTPGGIRSHPIEQTRRLIERGRGEKLYLAFVRQVGGNLQHIHATPR